MAGRTVKVWKGYLSGSTTHQGACNFCPWEGPVRQRGKKDGVYVTNRMARYMAVDDAFAHEDAEHPQEVANG